MIRVLAFLAFLYEIAGYPEIGFIAKLSADISRSDTSWQQVGGWVTSVTNVNGLYSVGMLIPDGREVTVPVSGIYFVAVSIAIREAGTGEFKAAVVRDKKLTTAGISLTSILSNAEGTSHSLDFNGFINLRAGENIAIYVASTTDSSWKIRRQSTFTLHFMGTLGVNPGFMVNLRSDSQITGTQFQVIKPWTSTTDAQHYGKSSGFSDNIGTLETVCAGVYILAANIIIDGPAGIYRLTASLNNTQTTIASKVTSQAGKVTLNLLEAFKLTRESSIVLQIASSVSGSKILATSQWSMQYIGEVLSINREFSTSLMQSFTKTSGFFDKLTDYIGNVTWHGSFREPSNLALSEKTNFLLSERAEFYYAMVNLHISGEATNLEIMIAVSANGIVSDGKEGPFSQLTKKSGETASVAFGGVLYLQKDEYISIFVNSFGKQYTVDKSSYISLIKMRYTVSSFSAQFKPSKTIQTTGWVELAQNWITINNGLHLYTKDFSSSTGRYTASFSGIYQLSANVMFNGNLENTVVSLTAPINGKINTKSGLYAFETSPGVKTTLHVFGSIFLASGSYVSLFVSSSIDNQYYISKESSFSLSLVGPAWAVPGFYTVLSNTIHRNNGENFEIVPWSDSEPGVSLFDNDKNFNYTSGRYMSPETAIYLVSANMQIRNSSHGLGKGEVSVEGLVNGKNLLGIGLQDARPTHAVTQGGEFTLSFSGVVKLEKGDYFSLFAKQSEKSSTFTIGKDSMFSIIKWSTIKNPPAFGFHAFSYSQAIISDKQNLWQGIKGQVTHTITTTPPVKGGFLIGSGFSKQESSDIYTVQEPGIYFISGSFFLGLANTASFEFALHINKKETDNVFYAMESQAKGPKYVLNFAAHLYLKTGQSLRVAVRSSSSLYNIEAGSSFSVIKLLLDEKNPGISVFKKESSTVLPTSQTIKEYDVAPVPKLFVSNVGFSSPNGSYVTRRDGIYLTTVSFVLGSAGSAGFTALGLVNSNTNRNLIEGGGSLGSFRTTVITRLVYLPLGKEYSTQLNVTNTFTGSADLSWSLYFIQPSEIFSGMSGKLSAERVLATTWTDVSPWIPDISSFPINSSFSYNTFDVPKEGVYHITFHGQFRNIKANVELSHAIFINSSVAVKSKWSSSTAEPFSFPVSASLMLKKGDIVTFKAMSSDGNALMTTGSTASVLDLTRVVNVQEGFFAHQPDVVTLSNTMLTATVLTNWATSGRVGSFVAVENSIAGNGTFVLIRAGFYQVSLNLLIENINGADRIFEAYGLLNQEIDRAGNLFVKQSVQANSKATLTISSIVRLERFTSIQILVKSGDNFGFKVNDGSTISVALLDDNGIPEPCYQTRLAVQNLVPEYKRILIGKSFSYTCNVIGSFPATFTWYKNNTVIPGEKTRFLRFTNLQKNDSSSYQCKVTYQQQSAITNTGILSVYDPTPTIVPQRTYSITVRENRGPLRELESFLVGAEKFAPGAALVQAHIVAGDPRNEFIFSNKSTSTVSISTTKSLDYEAQNHYVLTITAVNTEEPEARNTTIYFNVTVIDENDHPPVFNATYISTVYPEDLPIGSFIAQVNATDIETGINGRITYEIEGNSSAPYFQINNETGLITLKSPLDREFRDEHVIIVTARNLKFLAVAVVVVNVTDVNDNRPVFRQTFYNISIVENTPISSSVFQVFATDIDLNLNREIRFRLSSYLPNDSFSLDPQTGIIQVKSTLDYEQVHQYQLVIQAYDLGTPFLTSAENVTLLINLIDINDNLPHFHNSLYQKTLSEDTPVGSFVLQVVASDKDGTTANRRFIYIIPHPNPSEYFQIDSQGNITVKKSLDYEKQKSFEFTVIAKDSGNASLETNTTVAVIITDINDNFPVFDPGNYYLNVSEFTRPGTSVLRVKAKDQDSKQLTRLTYNIVGGNSNNYFQLLPNGDLYVFKDLDRETNDTVQIIINVTDGLHNSLNMGRVFINITDENDIRPAFRLSKYYGTVTETAAIGHSVLQVSAIDGDLGDNRKITYSILSSLQNPSSSMFAINKDTGVITVAKKLDYETQTDHHFVVIATDHGRVPLRSFTTVWINVTDVLDNSLVFDQNFYNASIPENFPLNSFITRVTAKDKVSRSSANIIYSLVDDPDTRIFSIDSITGIVKLKQLVDYETKDFYNVTVKAQDIKFNINITTHIYLYVLEVNDNRPRFEKRYYQTTIREDIAAMTSVYQVNATDLDKGSMNKAINFRLATNTSDFTIDNKTGVISSKRVLSFSRERSYSLVVVATDLGEPFLTSSALVDIFLIQVNYPPMFKVETYNVSVSEKALIGTSVLQIMATDPNSGPEGSLVYNITDQLNNNNVFYIDSIGNIYLNESLDYELKKEYRFRVGAHDLGSPGLPANSTVLVIVNVLDVNDNQPVFDINRYEKSIPEGLFTGTILTVRAVDLDGTSKNNRTYYYIVPSADAGNFTINNRTGEIRSAENFDREKSDRYSFEVEAKDTGRNKLSGRALIVVFITDINDNIPVPNNAEHVVNITETILVGSEILTIFASDKDIGQNAQLQFEIISGDTTKFHINRDNGRITVLTELFGEITKTFNLTVRVSDNGNPRLNSTVNIIINLIPDPYSFKFTENKYVFRIPEMSIRNPLGQVMATDNKPNTTAIYKILNINKMNISSLFYLNETTGVITMLRSLDFETRSDYDFSVVATSNRNFKTYSHVRIIVEDVNERPYFVGMTNGTYSANVSEHAHVGSYILTVFAADNDTKYSDNSNLTYSLMLPTSFNNQFSIDLSGRITLHHPLDYEIKNMYSFFIQVHDKGIPSLEANASVVVYVSDYNDNTPLFTPSVPLNISVPENIKIGTSIGVVNATDLDSNDNGRVVYSAVLPGDILRVNETNGKIYVNKSLDFEGIKFYEFVLIAEDRGTPGPLRSYRIIYLNIENVNDNRPIFSPIFHNITVIETAPVGTHITTVFSSDADHGAYGQIKNYTILSGDNNKEFTINSGGLIQLKKTLSFQRKVFYNLTVQAYDGGNPPLYANTPAVVTIHVKEYNNVQPSFTLNTYDVSIFENEVTPTWIVNVTATTPGVKSGPILYSIVQSNDSHLFRINNITGEIHSTISFDYERKRLYTFSVKAKDEANGRFGYSHVVVKVLDINDNRPVFTSNRTIYNISDATLVGSVVHGFSATDGDDGKNGQLVFSRRGPQNTLDMFFMNPDGTLFLQRSLDSRVDNIFTIIIDVTDLGNPALNNSLTIYIHVISVFAINLHKIEFLSSNYTVYVDEGTVHKNLVNTTVRIVGQQALGRALYEFVGSTTEISPFSINKDTGLISLDVPLDYEQKRSYNFIVTATTNKGTQAHTVVTVYVRDINDNGPIFIPSNYSVTLSEVSQIGSWVAQLTVKDNDTEAVNIPYFYQIISGNFNSSFNISNNGLIKLTKKIDLEAPGYPTQMILTVNVSEGFRYSTATVFIKIVDINDRIPSSVNRFYSFNVTENSPIGKEIGRVIAADSDYSNPNNQFTYELINTKLFKLQQIGAVAKVLVNGSIDYEEKNFHELVIVVSDSGRPTLQSLILVHVNVTDANDMSPVFSPTVFNNTIVERTPIGTIVVIVEATDGDTGVNGKISYSIVDPSATFSVNKDGVVSFIKPLDYETKRYYQFNITAMDGGNNPSLNHAIIHIYVAEINDNQPTFIMSYYYFNINEMSPAGTSVGQVAAFDKDHIGNSVTYSLVRSEHFNISHSSGIIYVTHPPDYDNVKQRMLTFSVIANDTGNPSLYSTAVVIVRVQDANDNDPVISPTMITVNISEVAPFGTIITTLNATDKDFGRNSKISWFIYDTTQTFVIDNFGVVRLFSGLNYKRKNQYTFIVKAQDDGVPIRHANSTVIVNVIPFNFERPIFLKREYEVTLPEDTPLQSRVVLLNYTRLYPKENFPILLEILRNINFPEFKADNNTKQILLQAPGLNYERQKRYDFTVVISNTHYYTDTANVIVHVTNVNEHRPRFTQTLYNITISELSFLGFTALHLVGMDNDTSSNSLTYQLLSGNNNRDFRMEGGRIIVNQTFQQSRYIFNISVTDPGGLKGFTTVIINIKPEYPPQFKNSTYIVNVYENILVGTSILQVLAGSSRRGITYTIEDKTILSTFNMNNITGNISTKVMLNYEKRKQYIFPVMASVTTPVPLSDSATVVINVLDINDVAPVFSARNFVTTVSEMHPVGSRVISLKFNDSDTNSGITFNIESGNDFGYFRIDNKGHIFLEKSLESQINTQYLRVRVFDGVHSVYTNVTIYIIPRVRCEPVFEQSLYNFTVPENKAVGTYLLPWIRLLNISASETTYNVTDSNFESTWRLNSSGYLVLQRKLDYETQTIYKSAIYGYQLNHTGQAAIIIRVTDINDEPPILSPQTYNLSLSERTPLGAEVITLNATDLDTKTLQYSLFSGNHNDTFSLSASGSLYLRKVLDYEDTRIYNIAIDVSDQNTVVRANVYIHVLDVTERVVCNVNLQ